MILPIMLMRSQISAFNGTCASMYKLFHSRSTEIFLHRIFPCDMVFFCFPFCPDGFVAMGVGRGGALEDFRGYKGSCVIVPVEVIGDPLFGPLPSWPDLPAQGSLWSLDPRASGYQLALLISCGGCCGQGVPALPWSLWRPCKGGKRERLQA